MDKKKMSAIAIISTAIMAITVIFSSTNLANLLKAETGRSSDEYVLRLDEKSKLTLEEGGNWDNPKSDNSLFFRATDNGNYIGFRFSGGRALTSFDNNFCVARNIDGWIANETPINGIKGIEIECAVGAQFEFTFSYNYELNNYSRRDGVPEYVNYQTETFTGSTKYTIVPDTENYTYFRFQQINETNNWIKHINVYFSCAPHHEHEWVHYDRTPANRGNTGLEEHYECKFCGGVQDKDRKLTTLEDLTLTSTLYQINSGNHEQAINLPRTFSLDETLYVDIFVGDESPIDEDRIFFALLDRENWERTDNIKIYKNGNWELTDLVGAKAKQGIEMLGETTDHYYRFKLDLSLMDRDPEFEKANAILIYAWNHNNGYYEVNTEGINVERGHYYPGGVNYSVDIKNPISFDDAIMNIDVKLDEGLSDSDALRIMVGDGWSKDTDYFKITKNGIFDDNLHPLGDYIEVTDLGGGYIRYTFMPSRMPYSGNPDKLNLFYIHNWSAASGFVDFSITEHEHDLVKTEAKTPLHDQDGNIEYYTCQDPLCEKIFNKDMVEISATDTVIPNKAQRYVAGTDLQYHFDTPVSGDQIIKVDFKPDTPNQNTAIALFENNGDWNHYRGYYSVNGRAEISSGEDGVEAYMMPDGYVRVFFDIAKLRKSNTTTESDAMSQVSWIYIKGDWTYTDGTIEFEPIGGTALKGVHKDANSSYTLDFSAISKQEGIIDVDVLFMNNSGNIRLMLGDGWNIYNGYYTINKDTQTGAYDGLYVSKLEDGYVRFHFVLDELTLVNDKPAPTEKFNLLYCSSITDEVYINVIPHENHVHVYNFVEGTDAFRSATGVKDHYECTCGKLYDMDYNEVSASDLVIPSRLYSFGPSNRPTISIPLDYQVDYGDEIILDFKVEADEHAEVGFTVGDTASNYFGKFWIESVDYCETRLQRTDYGITSQRLTDGYLRVTIPIDKTKIASNRQTNPDSIHTINTLDIYASSTSGWPTCTGTVEIMPSKGTIARGQKFDNSGLTINFDNHPIPKETSIVNVDVYYTSDDSTKISMCIGDWDNYNGYYTLYRDPSKMDNITGLTITQLDDGYVRYSFVLTELTKFNNAWVPIAAAIKYDHVYFRGGSGYTTAEGYVNVSVVSTIDSPILEDIY